MVTNHLIAGMIMQAPWLMMACPHPQAEDLAAEPGALAAAQGIMTTDRYPKLCSRELPNGARLVGIAKGAAVGWVIFSLMG